MKTKITLLAAAMLALLLGTYAPANAQKLVYNFTGGLVDSNPNGGQLGHEQVAPYGLFTGSEIWTAIGQSPFPNPGTGDFPYGIRLQREGYTGIAQMEQRAGGTAKDFIFGFGPVQTGSNLQNPNLEFRYVTQNQTAIPPTVSAFDIMTMVPATSKPVSSTLSALCFGIFPGPINPCYGRVGIERQNPSYTLDVNGIIRGNNVAVSSDARFKKDINTIDNSMGILQNLRGATYTMRDDESFGEAQFDFGASMESGFIAQELEEILPHLVYTDDQGYKSVNYMGVIPYLVEGVKQIDEETREEIATLKAENAELRAELDEIKSLLAGNSSDKGSAATATEFGSATLFQNTPNPFNQSTQIRYILPEESGQGQLLVFDLNGRQLRSYDLRSGEGSVTIEASELEAGMYIYSLIANGEEIATKRMILTK